MDAPSDPVGDVPSPQRRPCALGAGAEQLAGTASYDVTHLLIEHSGRWGRKAFAESDLPDHVRATVAARAESAGVRVHLIRRHGRAGTADGFRIYGANTMPGSRWLGTALLADPDELLDLDLRAWGRGRMAGLDRVGHPLLLVCTNGRRDACCAEFGRPIAKALARDYPEETWEVTHLGGHRFAGAMLTLPSGLSYGRLDPAAALAVAESTQRGDLVPSHLRGRVCYPPAAQVAEVLLREQHGWRGIDDLELATVTESGQRATATFVREGGHVTVELEQEEGPAVRASCSDLAPRPTVRWRRL
ncbi:sucrase ferredoxin [Nocardioides daejeonensis]|uniref:sucrase ferredoxin n=1 Tax=Nocardioides daejeonensis TaxID=1046556 RepID=UPI000D74DD0D|nr:sucrase ferredoxin [Nocardioides daejeonensis]